MKRLYTVLLAAAVLLSCNKGETLIDDDDPGYEFDKVTVMEYTPAPGQFINESYVPKDAKDAVRWAQERIDEGLFVSLGAFGGYIILKPSIPILSVKGYDFGIAGNPITTHNEPGIVWVSRDENGNGMPDDPWYELKGSDDAERGYSVTYFRTLSPEDVRWEDSNGDTGVIKYVPAYHDQNYYPTWCDRDGSFTLSGTLLDPNPGEKNGQLSHNEYGWGYVDNLGKDIYTNENGRYLFNRFDLANAVDASGASVSLERIDFLKVQSAVQYNLGHLGEVSTEVSGLVLLKQQTNIIN